MLIKVKVRLIKWRLSCEIEGIIISNFNLVYFTDAYRKGD